MSRLVRIAFAAQLIATGGPLACGSRHDASEQESRELVPECLRYEAALEHCFDRKVSFADQPSLIPANDADGAGCATVAEQTAPELVASLFSTFI